MSNEDLVREIQENKRDSLLLDLWERNSKLIDKLVFKYTFNGNEYEDLKQEAFIAFTAAVQTFNTASNAKFTTYLLTVLERAIRLYINCNGSNLLPQSLKQHITVLETFIDDFIREHNRKPTECEIERFTGYSEKDIKKYKLYSCMNLIKSLDEPTGEDLTPLGDVIASECDGIKDLESKLYAAERAKAVNKAVEELPSLQRDIIKLKYWDDETDKSTAARLRVSEVDVKRNYRQSIKQLRKNTELEEYYGDLRSRAMQGISLKTFRRTWTSATEREALKL